MKIGYNETFPTSGLEEDLIICEDLGYDLIELRIPYLREYLETHSVDELKQFFETHHIKPFAFNSVNDFNFVSKEEWDIMYEDFLFACRMAKELSCPNIVLVSTEREDMKLITEEQAFRSSVEALPGLCDVASQYGARVALEPIGNENWCIRSVRQAMEIINAVDRKNLGLTIDAFNIYIHDGFGDLNNFDLVPPEKIFVFHINDAMDKPIGSLMPAEHRLYPGDGCIPLERLLRKLEEIGYSEMASLELFGDWIAQMNPKEGIEKGYKKTKNVITSVFQQ